jgi:predicted MPP superfamily phosphohydrolase
VNDIITGAAVCALLIFLICALYNGLTVRYYTVSSSKITKPVRILQITDLHSSRYGAGQKKLLAKIDECRPDIICMTGDIFDERVSSENTAALIRSLRGYRTFFCTGNHELYMRDLPEILKFLGENGVAVLDGNAERACGISVCGVSDPKKEECGEAPDDPVFARRLSSARSLCREDDFKLLLSHRPERISEYLPHGFDLVLSGHAHGGQWRLPYLVNGLWAPHQGFFPEYAGGIYRHAGTTHIVCRGLSKFLMIPRLFNPVEFCCIDLKVL